MTELENLKEETIRALKEEGKTVGDVKYIIGYNVIGVEDDAFWEDLDITPIELEPISFWRVADEYYDSDYGIEEVRDFLVVGDDWWLERHSYDGSEWWEYKTLPPRPSEVTKTTREYLFTDWHLNERS